VRAAILAFATSRIALGVACYICLQRFPAHTILDWQTDLFPGHDWINGWFRWDSFWYLAIADPSMAMVPAGYSAANFFPLYSWVSLLVSMPLRIGLAAPQAFGVAALLVSNAAFFVALLGVHRLASSLAGAGTADRAVWLIAWFPFSFFLSAGYSDALYFCLAVWAFVFARERRWLLASVLAAAAAMTRIPGALLAAAIVLEYLRQEGANARSLTRAIAPAAILAVAPLVIALYFWTQFGHPLAFLQARQAGWGRATGPVAAMAHDVNEFFAGPALDCGSIRDCVAKFDLTRHLLGVWYGSLIAISLALVLGATPLLGVSQTFWVVASVLMAMTNGLDGTGRFTVVLFPVFVAAAARLRSMRSVAVVCACFVPFLMLFLFQFARWRPVL
jgi:hypothetical protein